MKKLSALIGLCLASCSGGQEPSHTQEAPDSRNLVSRFEISHRPNYAELAATPEVFAPHLPWSDTYWPLTDAGLARRWATIGEPSAIGFSSFWRDQRESVQASRVNPLLSPGEKYDLVYRLRHHTRWSEEELEEQVQRLAGLEEIYSDYLTLDEKRKTFDTIYKAFNETEIFRKWSPMAANGWERWLNYNKNPRYKFRNEQGTGDDWSWMGYCHGWAAAALMHESPKLGVMAKIDGKEVFFSEGDIRGLLTIAWSDHSPDHNQYFLGRRCNENTSQPEGPIPVASDGRGVTGSYRAPDGSTKTFTAMDEYWPAAASGKRVYAIRIENEASSGFLIEHTAGGQVAYYLSGDTQQLKFYLETGSLTQFTRVSNVKFYGCWDVNPASFHTVLTEYVGKKKLGFVMDRTRTGQVWNQPVHGARFTVGPLLPAAETEDYYFRYRAPGTSFLAVVSAVVHWSSEPARPSLAYAEDFDEKRMRISTYHYTLEFDAAENLIGGEWGGLQPSPSPQVIPDFLYAFKPGSVPEDTPSFDYSGIIKPIHACSLLQDESKIKLIQVNGQNLRYVACELWSL